MARRALIFIDREYHDPSKDKLICWKDLPAIIHSQMSAPQTSPNHLPGRSQPPAFVNTDLQTQMQTQTITFNGNYSTHNIN
jgi:hypothetical protein